MCLTIVCSFLRVLANSVSINTREPTSMGVELGSCANGVISRVSCLYNGIYNINIVRILPIVLCKMSLSFALSISLPFSTSYLFLNPMYYLQWTYSCIIVVATMSPPQLPVSVVYSYTLFQFSLW